MGTCKICGKSLEYERKNRECCKECAKSKLKEHQQLYKARKNQNLPKEPRCCKVCGASLEGEHANREYCIECAKARRRERDRLKNERKRKNISPEPKYCKVCGVSLEGRHINAEYCMTCYLEHSKQYQKEYVKSHLKPRACLNCGADISDRPHNSVRCKPCQKEYEVKLKKEASDNNRVKARTKKKSNIQNVYDLGNLAKKYHTSYGKLKHDIQIGRVKIKEEDREIAKELGLM